MTLTEDDVTRNLNQFMEKYGQEGFLRLLFTNYLYELILLNLHSKPRKEKNDTSHLLYFNFRGKAYPPDQVDSFKLSLKKECANRADSIVRTAKESGLLQHLTEDPSRHPGISRSLEHAFKAIIKEIER